MSEESIIKLEGAVIRQQKNTILSNVNLTIEKGEFIYIIGRVGSGKTSLLKSLYAELPLAYGKGEVAGFKLNRIKKSQVALLRRKCGIVFQDFKLLTDRDVRANLEFVLKATGWKNKKAICERIDEVLQKVDMAGKKNQFPHQLSGGEQQRVVLARALLNAPPIILADEPTGNIDPESSYQLVELLKDICDGGKTVLIATHQYDLIERFPGRVFRCEEGRIFEDTSFQKMIVSPDVIKENTGNDLPETITGTETFPADIPSNEETDVKEEEFPASSGENIPLAEGADTETSISQEIPEETVSSPIPTGTGTIEQQESTKDIPTRGEKQADDDGEEIRFELL